MQDRSVRPAHRPQGHGPQGTRDLCPVHRDDLMQRMEVEQAFGTPQDRMVETEYIISRKRSVRLAGVEAMHLIPRPRS